MKIELEPEVYREWLERGREVEEKEKGYEELHYNI
jgi:hypothetical protein